MQKQKVTYEQRLWRDFHQEIQYYYYNGEHIYDTPNRERDYARIGEPVMKSPLSRFTHLTMAKAMGGEYAGVVYDRSEE